MSTYVRIVKGGWTPDYLSGVWLVTGYDGLGAYHLRRPGKVETDVECRTDHVQTLGVLDLMVIGITPESLEESDDFRDSSYFCRDGCNKTYWIKEPCKHFVYCEYCDDTFPDDGVSRCWCYE